MSTTDRAVSAKSSPRGRKATTPTTELGTFIQNRLNIIGMTRSEMAKRLCVSPSTIGRLLNGDTRVVQRVRAESICEVLGFDEMDRRAFLKLATGAGAGTFALATGVVVPGASKTAVNLDLAHDHTEALQRLLNKGEVQYVMKSAQRWYDTLLQEQPYKKDTRYAATQIRFGMLLGYAQEAFFPWYQRGNIVIQTYSSIENDIICRFELSTFRQEYTNLLSHRAPLYREIGLYDESARQFEYGISWAREVDDPMLRSNIFCSRAHVTAARGDERL